MLCSLSHLRLTPRAGVCGSSETGKEGLELLVVAGGYLPVPVPLTLRNTGHGTTSDAVGGSQDFQDLSGLNSD